MTPEKNGMALAAEDEEAIDVVLREGGVSAKLVKSALEDDLLPLLPLVICTPQTDELLNALQERLCTSRVLKLRYLLLRNHHAFRSIPCKRRFSSMAYGPVTCSRDFQKSKKLVVEADEKTEPVGLRLLVDMVDLQSEEFFRNEVFRQASREASSFGHTLVSHPFLGADETEVTSQTDGGTTLSDSGVSSLLPNTQDFAQCAYLKVIQGESVVRLRRICPISNLLDEKHTDRVLPEMVVRSVDNTLGVVATQMLLRLFNAAWVRPSRQFPDAASAPYCRVPDTAVVGPTRLLETALEKHSQMENFNFDYWRYTKGLDPVVADSFVRSAAGLFTAGYVLGLGRHVNELGITDGREMYFRDVKGAFEHATMARLIVPKEMKEAFAALGVLDTFRDTCVSAFSVLRECYGELLPIVFELFKLSGISKEKILQHAAGRNSLNLAEDRIVASAYFRKWIDTNTLVDLLVF